MPNAKYVFRDYETDGVPSSGPHKVKKSDARAWGTMIEQNSQLANSPLIYGAVGDGTTNDAANYALAEAANDNIFLPSQSAFNLGSAIPTKPIFGPGSIISNGTTLDGALLLHKADRSSIVANPRTYTNTDWLLDNFPAASNHGNTLIGAGIKDTNDSHTARTTAVGSLILTRFSDADRVTVMGFGSLRFSEFVERFEGIGYVAPWGGSNPTQDANGKFWHHPLFYNGNANPNLVLGTPGAYTLNPAWIGNNAFNLTEEDGQSIVTWMNTNPWATSTADFAYTQAFGRDALNSIIKGIRDAAYGYRSLGLLLQGDENTAIGNNALFEMLFGNRQVALGVRAGLNHKTGDGNVYIGPDAGRSHKNGSASVIIGSNAGFYGGFFDASWSVLIGQDAGIRPDGTIPATLHNRLLIQDRYTRSPLLNGDFSAGRLGINMPIDNLPLGTLHVFAASAGSITPAAGASQGIFENNGNAGISILTPATSVATIAFARPGSNLAGYIQFDHNTNRVTVSGARIRLSTLPTSASGLTTGDLWNDAGTVKIAA
ncbi:hypothetical protein SAMN02982989_3427 [Xaviernesmea oryzae]|uniref:Uncharacterized protein n=1 Tax=Xaviernesmea oryzae TaxID=464029 RepID=A0A1X7G8W4_9HYPH|nr:hypothetical protein [Xaviernesmea oryzae]SMF65981.1 hypothetical protein SAMN02982989_3427 [Xaviernesmea oryzae]